MEVFVGTSGYAYKEWKGAFYPEKISANKMLSFYSQQLNSVEINNSFYRMPTERVLNSWAEQVPDQFAFAVKAPQVITHIKQLQDVREQTEFLFTSLFIMEKKLGAVLFQFPKSFHSDPPLLKDFLELIPRDVRCSFAFRSKSWLNSDVLGILADAECSVCLEDTDEEPADKILSTTNWGYLRLRRPAYSEAELLQWREDIFKQKWDRVFVFFKHEDESSSPLLAKRFQEIMDSGRRDGATSRPTKTG